MSTDRKSTKKTLSKSRIMRSIASSTAIETGKSITEIENTLSVHSRITPANEV